MRVTVCIVNKTSRTLEVWIKVRNIQGSKTKSIEIEYYRIQILKSKETKTNLKIVINLHIFSYSTFFSFNLGDIKHYSLL